MRPALSQVCSLNSPWDKDVEDYAAGACGAIEIWLGKLESYLDSHSIADAQRILERHAMAAPVASFQGGLLASQGESRRAHWDHFGRRLDLCRSLGIGTLVVACDIDGPIDNQVIDRARLSLRQAARQAAEFELRLALEFQARSALGNNVQTAASLVAEAAEGNLGICFDVFHYYMGPSKPEDLAALDAKNLFHVQLSDLAGQPRELAADADRILPGDGDFQFQPILDRLGEIGYGAHVSVELMNPQIWQVPARQFGEIAMTALRKLLGQAGMGGTALG
jgi:sugar phosphate isomerase/epimerase